MSRRAFGLIAATLFAITLAPALAAQTPSPTAPRAEQLRQLDAYIQKGMKDWGIPGLSVSVVKNDTVILSRGYGVRALGKPGAVDDQTLFGIMSTTKAFTAMGIAMLVDDGKLKWSDKVTRWVPEFEFPDAFLGREATVKDLLTHDIGFGNADLLWVRGDLSRAEIFRRMRFVTPAYSLRSDFVYQNIMFGLAGEVIERASGMRWSDFTQQRILTPLGMTRTRTSYGAMLATHDANQSEPHYRIRDTIRVIADDSVDAIPEAGAIWSTAADMAKWMRFLLDSGRVNGKRLVSEAGYREIMKPQSFVGAGEFYPTARLTRPHWTTYGLGWFQQDFRGRFLAFHTGSLDGRTAIIGLEPDQRVGVYVFGNLDHAEFRHALMLQAIDLFAGTNGQPVRNWSDEFLPLYAGIRASAAKARAAEDAKRVMGTQPSLPLAGYAGTYTHPAWGDLVVSLVDGALHLQLGAGPLNGGTLGHWNYDTFRATLGDGRNGPNTFTFLLDPEGKATRVMLDGSAEYTFVRAP
jgi:CubicO group peptidase (beta-lactamase class C family)